jgi:hypothetical protein
VQKNKSKKLEGGRLVNRGKCMAKNDEKRGEEKKEHRGREWGGRIFGHTSR